MLPRLDGFLAGIRLFVRRRRPQAGPLDEAMVAAALEHARQLAAGKEQDEPAALFFACALRSRAITFEELRDTFSAAVRTAGQGSGRPPPRRPG